MSASHIRISRRSFLQAAGLTALAGGLAACGSTAQSTAPSASAPAYSLEDAVKAEFTDSGITLSPENASGCTVEGTVLTITAAGTYAVSGSCADGSIQIRKGTEDVTLVLNGLTLTSTTTAPLVCGKSSGVTLAAAEGTENTLTDGEANNKDNANASEDAESAVVKCKDGSQVVLCGTGTLNLHAVGKNGIKSGTTEEDRDASLTIRALTLNIDAPVNDAINAEQQLNVESGTLNIAAGDDAVHCDLYLNVGAEGTDGPTINISTCSEGLEAAEMNIYSGKIDITASDDCLNAANSDLEDYAFVMNIMGGTINACSSEGDGFDSNGTLTISGGNIAVWTANTADNQPLDADGLITITGGTILAAGGSSGMDCSISAEQPYVTYGGSREKLGLASGAGLSVCDADGKALYTAAAVCSTNFVFFSSPELSDEATYTLTADSSEIAAADAQTGEVAAGMSGGPGGGQAPGNGPAPADGQTPPEAPEGTIPPDNGQAPAGGQPPQKPGTDTAASGSTSAV